MNRRHYTYRYPRAVSVTLVLCLLAPACIAEGQRPLDAHERAAVVAAVNEVLTAVYIDEAVAKRGTAALRALLASGDLDNLREPQAFAARLTHELLRTMGDLHLEVRVRPLAPAGSAPASPPAWREPLRRRGKDFRRVEWLSGGVAYLDVRSFPPLEVARPTAEAAMSLLSDAEAVILDLRRNSGGTGEMVELLAGYFLPRTLLATTYKRSRSERRESWTRSDVPVTRLREVPLYLLTSAATFSAAEGFAYELQARRRAVVVGEVTRGGANPGSYEPAGERFEIFCPDVLVRSAATGSNWEGVGVRPELHVGTEEALDAAHRQALERLRTAATSPVRRKELGWALAALDAGRHKDAPPPAGLVGVYGDFEVAAGTNGLGLRLRRNRGLWSRLLPLDGDAYALEGTDGVQLRFSGAPRALVLTWADGEVQRHERSPAAAAAL